MPKTLAFKKLKNALTSEYVGKIVPKEFQERYGKKYDEEEMEQFAYAVARSRGIRVEKKDKW